MIKLILLFFAILILNFLYVVLFNCKFGKALPITLITFFFIAFISGIIGNLSTYKYVLPCFAVCLSLIIYFKNKNISLKNYLKNYFNLSFICFSISFFYFWFLFKNVGITNMDDLFHWSLSVNTIVKSGTLLPIGWYVNTYPPFVTWYISMVCYILGGYSESFCLFALSNLCLSFIFPFIDSFNFKKKYVPRFFLAITILILAYLCVNITEYDQFVFVFNSIYIDWIMAILFAYQVFLIFDFSNTSNDFIYFSLILSALVLTKQVSLPLSLICVFALLIKLLINKQFNIFKFLYVIIIPLLIYASWSLLLKNISNTQPILSSLSVVSEASNRFLSKNTNTFKTISDFIKAFFLKPIIFRPFQMSYFFFVTLLFAIQIAYGIINKNTKDYFSTSIVVYLGSFGYALVMLLSYIIVLSDGYSLPLYSRYMQTYTFAYLLICVFIFIRSEKLKVYIPVLIVVLLCVEPSSVSTLLISKEDRFFKQSERTKVNQYIRDIYNNENLATVYSTDIRYSYSIKFMFYDNKKFENISLIQITKDNENISDNLKTLFTKYEYILVSDYDTTLENYWKKISNTPLYNSTLYKVISCDNDIEIELVEIFE